MNDKRLEIQSFFKEHFDIPVEVRKFGIFYTVQIPMDETAPEDIIRYNHEFPDLVGFTLQQIRCPGSSRTWHGTIGKHSIRLTIDEWEMLKINLKGLLHDSNNT